MIRTLWVGLVAFFGTLRYGLPILWRASRGSDALECTCRQNPRRWSRRIVRAAGVEVTLEGAHNLSPDAPAILVPNHQSWFDVWTLTGWLPVDFCFVAKKELETIPVFGAAWQACGHISIDRSDRQHAIASLERAGQVMRERRPTVIMFAEGTRSRTGELLPFKKGAFVLALETGVPIVPAAILGSRDVMPKGSFRIRKGRVRLRIGQPIPVEGLTLADRDALIRVTHDAVRRLMAGEPLEGPWGDIR
jgi:1-acyl-sn-glycerol-3-phosphate acyltransferase